MSNFQPIEVVGRGSKTQLQVGENLNRIAYLKIPSKIFSVGIQICEILKLTTQLEPDFLKITKSGK